MGGTIMILIIPICTGIPAVLSAGGSALDGVIPDGESGSHTDIRITGPITPTGVDIMIPIIHGAIPTMDGVIPRTDGAIPITEDLTGPATITVGIPDITMDQADIILSLPIATGMDI
jgi:hypothetical protein